MAQYTRDTSTGSVTLERFDAATFAQLGRAISQIDETVTLKDITVKDLIRGDVLMRSIKAHVENDGSSDITSIGILQRAGETWITGNNAANDHVWDILKNNDGATIQVTGIDPARANVVLSIADSISKTLDNAIKVSGPEQAAKYTA